MAKQPKKLDDLFHDTLKDIYYAEKKILTALPKMAKAAQNEDLRAAFEKHEAETEEQIGRLEEVFAAIDENRKARSVRPSTASLKKGRRSSRSTRGRQRWTPAFCPPRRLS